MVNFGFTILLGIEDAVVKQPELVGGGIEVDAVDHPNAFDNAMSLTRVLTTHQLDLMSMFFVEYRVIKQHVALWAELDLMAHLLPEPTRGKPARFEEVLYIVVGEALKVISQIRTRIVDLTAEQKLAVKLSGDFQDAVFTLS